jgi:hypothetical protein
MKILTKISKALVGTATADDLPKVITFSGGMGAQVISAAIYFAFQNEGREVYADMSYFKAPAHVATVGNPGEISQWPWQLEPFGLPQAAFRSLPDKPNFKFELIVDGLRKQTLSLKSLLLPEVQRHFAITASIDELLPPIFASGYMCVHVRRGDYVNVASHLITDEEFIQLAKKFHGLASNLVVVSDSPVEDPFRAAISAGFEQSIFLDSIDAFTTHKIMRLSRILICSNSQFSLVAALLNTHGLIVLPKQWFGGKDRELEDNILALCGFQILR